MKLLRTPLEVWLDLDIPELRVARAKDEQMQQIARVYNWVQAESMPVPDLARLDAELEQAVAEAKDAAEREWREAYEAALERCISAAKISALNSELRTAYFKPEDSDGAAFEYADGIPMGPRYKDWMFQVHEILRTDQDAPDELEVSVPESCNEFFDLMLDEAGLETEGFVRSISE